MSSTFRFFHILENDLAHVGLFFISFHILENDLAHVGLFFISKFSDISWNIDYLQVLKRFSKREWYFTTREQKTERHVYSHDLN